MATIHGWYRPSHIQTLLTLRSPLHSLHLHWLDDLQRHVRCMGTGCRFCSLSVPIKFHSAACVQWEGGGQFKLLEFTAAHAELVNTLDNIQTHVVGQQLKVQRVERRGSLDLDYELAGHVDVAPIYCARYVEAIGRREYFANVLLIESTPERFCFEEAAS